MKWVLAAEVVLGLGCASTRAAPIAMAQTGFFDAELFVWLVYGVVVGAFYALMIGLFEGSLLAWRYHIDYRRSIRCLILADIVIAILTTATGWLTISFNWRYTGVAWAFLVVMFYFLRFAISVLIAWPFVRRAFPSGEAPGATAWRATLLVKSATYAVGGLTLLASYLLAMRVA